MGNSMSTTNNVNNSTKEFESFYDVINDIATYYILTMDFKSLTRLSEKEYCDKLVVLTADIIKESFTDMEIKYLEQKIQNGEEINKMTQNKFIFFKKDDIDSLDVSNDRLKTIKKKRVCIGIAKYYIKIAHLFAAIIMTINPTYVYRDEFGQIVKTKFLDKNVIPPNVIPKLKKQNICDNRINALRKGHTYDEISETATLHSDICSLNLDSNTPSSLNDEPGMIELMHLYLDEYDYSTGAFTGMSDTAKRQYMNDLSTFYKAFTGNSYMPSEITKFSDIKLRDYDCVNDSSTTIKKDDPLFVKYANNIKSMIETAANNQQKLLSVINDIFSYNIEPYTGKKKIRINPKLNEQILQKAIEKTRKYIINLYVQCEMDYVNGINIYKAIVEKQGFNTNVNQLKFLNKQKEQIINNTLQLNNLPKQVDNGLPIGNNSEEPPINEEPQIEENPSINEELINESKEEPKHENEEPKEEKEPINVINDSKEEPKEEEKEPIIKELINESKEEPKEEKEPIIKELINESKEEPINVINESKEEPKEEKESVNKEVTSETNVNNNVGGNKTITKRRRLFKKKTAKNKGSK